MRSQVTKRDSLASKSSIFFLNSSGFSLEKLKTRTKIKDGLKKYIKTDGTPQIDHDVVKESEKYDGLYVIITAQETLTTEEVVQKYFEKDLIEKAFRSLKDILSMQPVRHWLTCRIRAHIFICYLSYFHLSWMGMLLKTQGILTSPVKVLQELETIYSVELTDTKTDEGTGSNLQSTPVVVIKTGVSSDYLLLR